MVITFYDYILLKQLSINTKHDMRQHRNVPHQREIQYRGVFISLESCR